MVSWAMNCLPVPENRNRARRSRGGNSRGAMNSTYRKPADAMTRPATENSKNVNGVSLSSIMALFTSRLVLDPTSVVIPPSTAA